METSHANPHMDSKEITSEFPFIEKQHPEDWYLSL